MDFDRSAVQRADLDFERDDLPSLHGLENPCQHALFGPAPHPCVDGMPMPMLLGQPPPLGPIFRDIEDGIEHFQIAVSQAPAMFREEMGDAFTVVRRQLQKGIRASFRKIATFTLTGSRNCLTNSPYSLTPTAHPEGHIVREVPAGPDFWRHASVPCGCGLGQLGGSPQTIGQSMTGFQK